MKFAYYNKTYINDLYHSKSLYNSFKKHYKGSSLFYITCPKQDYDIFLQHFPKDILIVDEEVIAGAKLSLDEFSSLKGWEAQQIVKLCIPYFTNIENYLTIDSDCLFTRDFTDDIFFYQNEVKTIYFSHKKNFTKDVKNDKILNFDSKKIKKDNGYFISSHQLFDSQVIYSLSNYIKNTELLDFIGMIKYYPFEISWYGKFLYQYHFNLFHPVKPFFGNITGINKNKYQICIEVRNKSFWKKKLIGFYLQYPATYRDGTLTIEQILNEFENYRVFPLMKNIINFLSIFFITKSGRLKARNYLSELYLKSKKL